MARIAIVLGVTAFLFFAAIIWIGGWFLGLSLALKIVLTAVVIAVAITIVAILYVVRIAKADKIAKELVAPPRKSAPLGGGAKSAHAASELHVEAANAVAVLKQSRMGGGGRAALYSLPWYAIIGPPGVGKTTALRHSGLEFPLQSASIRGVGGTRNCDWWFTNEAILLDTAGRYSVGEGEDQHEWFSFLDLLKKYRPRKPLNGLIVAIPVTSLMGASEAELTELAARLRARIDEITTHLKTLMPVYVLLTKMDLVAGFTDFWGDLLRTERAQPWGIAFPLHAQGETRGLVERELDLLIATLHARALRRFSGERHIQARQKAAIFPMEIRGLEWQIATFVENLFQKNTYQELPFLRGLYFTSGTQNVSPTSHVLAHLGASLGLAPRTTNNGGAVEPKSYFLGDVFRRVIFPDRDLAGHTEGEKRRRLLIRVAAAALTVLMAASLVVPAFFTWLRNRELVSSTADVAQQVEGASWNDATTLTDTAPRLDAAQARLRELSAWQETGVPVQLRWGMYTGRDLYAGLRDVYAAALSRAFVNRTKRALEEQLRALDAGPVRTTESFNRDFDTLKLYLMLGDPKHVDPAWAAPRLARAWSVAARPRERNDENLLIPHLAYLLELERAGEVRPWDLDPSLVTRARSILAQTPQVERLYEALVRDANTEIAPIKRETIFYGSVAPFVQSRKGFKVDGAYTKAGWARIRVLLGEQKEKLAAEQWVLGDPDGTAGADAIAKLRDLYFERYRNAWRDFIADLQVQDPGNAELALAELNSLSEPEWPYLRLIRVLNDNVTLDMADPDKSTVEKAVDKVQAVLEAGAPKKRQLSPVERAFKPMLKFGLPPDVPDGDATPTTGLSQYESLLAKLVGALTDLRDSESGTDPRKVSDVFQDASRTTSALLSEQDGFTRPLLSPLLMQPVTLAWSNVVRDAGAAVGANWESSVWQQFHDKLEGKYPFADSPTDASLDDFLDFLAPDDGVLWQFYDESLKATLDRNGSSFVPSRRFKSSVEYTSAFLDVCLKRGQQFTQVLFPPKTDKASVVFDVNIHSVSPSIGEVTFEVDGVTHTYRNEPEQWVTITWPGKAHGAKLRVRGAGGLDEELTRPGDFGLFRLLDAAEIKPGRAAGRADGVPTLVATWNLRASRDAAAVNLDFRPSRNETPLEPGFFRGYTCPRAITTN